MHIQYLGNEKKRLDTFLAEQMSDRSRSSLQKLIKVGAITVNEKKTTVHNWLKNGDQIFVDETSLQTPRTLDMPTFNDPEIVAETDSYLIVNKPTGLITHPTERNEKQSLSGWATKHDPSITTIGDPQRPGIVHRLDKDVGGLVIIAKKQTTFEYLKYLFQERKIEKKYFALVHGELLNDEGKIDTPLQRDKKSGRMVADSATEKGKTAHTTYSVLKRYKNYTLLDVQILTGRTHQIRAHLFSIGHSIVGDPIYRTRDIRKQDSKFSVRRPLLFAYYLSFKDEHDQIVTHSLPLPNFFKKVLQKLKEL